MVCGTLVGKHCFRRSFCIKIVCLIGLKALKNVVQFFISICGVVDDSGPLHRLHAIYRLLFLVPQFLLFMFRHYFEVKEELLV